MRLVFDVLASNDVDTVLSTLRSGVSINSPVAPIRLTLNSEKQILSIASVGSSDVCLGPFENNDRGLEEAVYDAIHFLASKGLIEEYYLSYADEKTLIGRYDSLDPALKARRHLLAVGTDKEPLVSLKMKTDWQIQESYKDPLIHRSSNGV